MRSHLFQGYDMMPVGFGNSMLQRGYYEEPYLRGPPLSVMQVTRSLKHSSSAPPVDGASADAASPYFKVTAC